MNLRNAVPVVVRQTADAVCDVQLMLTHDGRAWVGQQFVVVQQRAGNGILYRRHADDRRVFLNVVEHLFECRAADKLYLLTLEIQVCRNVVERPYQSLYRYSLHLSVLLIQKTPLSPYKWSGAFISFFILILSFLPTAFRFTVCCKVKVIAVKVILLYHKFSVVFSNCLQKYNIFTNLPNISKEIFPVC